MNVDEIQDASDEEIPASVLEELLGGGLENEVAAIGGFSATMFLQVAKRQIALIKTLEALLPEFKDSFQVELERPETLVQAASMLGAVIEECVDDETPEDSMLLQVLDHCSALVDQQ